MPREEDISESNNQSARINQIKTQHHKKSVVEYTNLDPEPVLVTKREHKQSTNALLMQTPAAAFQGSIYRGNDENKKLYASAIRHDYNSSIKKAQLTRRTANSKSILQLKKQSTEDSANRSRPSSVMESVDQIQAVKQSQTAFSRPESTLSRR
jgi:hypothetical protein